MQTEIQKLKDKINELESWLRFNHAEHLAVTQIQADLRKAKEELAQLENERPFERDTFDLRDHQFNFSPDERK